MKPHALKRDISGLLRCEKLRIDEFLTRKGNILGHLFSFLLVPKL